MLACGLRLKYFPFRMGKSYVEQYKLINVSSVAGEIGQTALVLAAELQQMPEISPTLTERQTSLSKDVTKLIQMAAVELVPDIREGRAPIHLFSELSYLSQGFSEEEAGEARGLTKNAVKTRRRDIKAYMGTRTRNDTVTQAIQRGLVHIEKDDSDYKALSWMEDRVLAFAAAGWTTSEIAKHFLLSQNTIDRHYEEIRIKLKAKNIPHAVRRGFEVGIFKMGEPISTSSELPQELTIRLNASNNQAISLAIKDPREIDLLRKIAKIGDGSLTAKQAIEAEGSSDKGKMPHVGRTMLSLAKRLEEAAERPVIVKSYFRINGSRVHIYRLATELCLSDGKDEITIPEYKHSPLKGGRPKSNQVPVKRKPPQKPKAKATINPKARPKAKQAETTSTSHEATDPIIPDIISHDELPSFNDALLDSLVARDANEVLNNREIKLASMQIHRNNSHDYRTRIVLLLRYGMPPQNSSLINRSGKIVKATDIAEYLPPYRGLDVKSASLVCGLTPLAILKSERDFIRSFKREFPALAQLEDKIDTQITDLERSNFIVDTREVA